MLVPENYTVEFKIDYLAIGLITAAVLLVMTIKYKVLKSC
jgi:hypothetical protein